MKIRTALSSAGLLAAALLLAFVAPARADVDDLASPSYWYGRAADGSPTVKVYFYWTQQCEHCRAARPFLEALPSKLPYVELVSRPTDGSASNARLQYATARALGADTVSVPAIFFCGEAQIGYDTPSGVGASLVRRIEACRSRLAADPTLLTKPVAVLAEDLRGDADGGGGVLAAVIVAAFLGLIAVGVVLSRKAAAERARATAAKHAGGKRKKR